ncbi:MAG: hypothetical protein VX741_11805, partial [Pseudomonadota bacterium]|nr:hypothetical protein [Pseudomonadota bacterium]
SYVDEWIHSLKNLEAMDFEILSTGHGRIGVKRDVRDFRSYMESLRDQVTNLARAGHSVDEIVYKVTMDKYRSWFGYDKYVEANPGHVPAGEPEPAGQSTVAPLIERTGWSLHNSRPPGTLSISASSPVDCGVKISMFRRGSNLGAKLIYVTGKRRSKRRKMSGGCR